ncbi:MAG TPA: serine protease [Acidimicrobiia bacterium]|nr:serine protease [Acidimicrobiia bacterium]
MSFFDSPLGERLATSLDTSKPEDIAAAVGAIEAKVWAGKVQPDQIDEVLAELQRNRQVQHVIDVADAATAVGSITTSGRRRYCQMLIESGALHAAELACAELLDLAEDVKERGEALGLLGRIRKQRYVTSRRPEDLVGAVAAYQFAYAGGGDRLWHGINVLALTSRADRDGIPVPEPVDGASLAHTLLDLVRQTEPDVMEIWERTTEIEALVALGDKASLDEAVSVAQQLAGSKSVRPFELESLRRQLADIWELEPHHPVLVAIADQKLHLGARAHVELPDTPSQLEKIFGTALPVGYKHLMRGLECAESVGKITDASDEPWGTGFLLRGSSIHADLGDGLVLATNAHVCSPEPGVGKLLPGEAKAVFDVTKSVDGAQLVLTGFECVWSSPPSVCDVTILRFTGPEPALKGELDVAGTPPPVTDGAYVYVIGHPAGGGIKFSIRGNDLLAYDAEMFKVHYTAPTEGGSSGSPVFNQAWQLMAVHHAGDSKMRRLDDPSATYQANEGITIKGIREEYEKNG